MTKITMTLYGTCAKTMLRELALRYARLCLRSKMIFPMANGPWLYGSKRKRNIAEFREWMANVDRMRADYRKTLETMLPEVPPVPDIDLTPFRRDGYFLYPAHRIEEIASGYATSVTATLGDQGR